MKRLVPMSVLLSACVMAPSPSTRDPAAEYAAQVRTPMSMPSYVPPAPRQVMHEEPRARVSYAVNGETGEAPQEEVEEIPLDAPRVPPAPPQEYYKGQDYNGPLSLGDPGVSASLFQESRAARDLFHDFRAWQPMDLLTIVISENAEGSKQSNTKITSESKLEAAVSQLLGLEGTLKKTNPQVDATALIGATTDTEFQGQGQINRVDRLKGTISAMIEEVLPSGILRIKGEKIISVNGEDQTMIISGLVRPQDISSANEVDSRKLANVRIDYYGKGPMGDVAAPGWLFRLLIKIWPF